MNRNKIMEWLRRNGWGVMTEKSFSEYTRHIHVSGFSLDAGAFVSVDIQKSELEEIELRDIPGEVTQ